MWVCCSGSTRRLNRKEVLGFTPLIEFFVFFLPGNQPVLGFAFIYLSWVEPVLGGCFSRRAPEGSNRGLLFFFFFFFFPLGETSTIGGCFCGFVVPGAPEGSTGRRF